MVLFPLDSFFCDLGVIFTLLFDKVLVALSLLGLASVFKTRIYGVVLTVSLRMSEFESEDVSCS